MMNAFILAGDFCHLFAMILLLFIMLIKKSCHGISGKSQVLIFMVFVARHMDLSSTDVLNVFCDNNFLKFVYLLTSLSICVLIHTVYRATYQRTFDTGLTEFTVFVAFISAIFDNYHMTPLQIIWAFSHYLEPATLLPQFFLIILTKKVSHEMIAYLAAMVTYKIFYTLKWIIYGFNIENYTEGVVNFSGIVYILLFIIFSCIIFCRGVEIDKEQHFIKRNIFIISHSKIILQKDIEKNLLISSEDEVATSENEVATLKHEVATSKDELITSKDDELIPQTAIEKNELISSKNEQVPSKEELVTKY